MLLTTAMTGRIVFFMKTFKSARAAQVAVTKADNAYATAVNDLNGRLCAMREAGYDSEEFDAIEAGRKAAFEKAIVVFNEATEWATNNGCYVHSRHFSYCATRELIAANID